MAPGAADSGWLSPQSLLAIITFGLSVVIIIIGAAMVWGAERQARKDLQEKHNDLAKEVRLELKPQLVAMERKIAELERDDSTYHATVSQKLDALTTASAEKASKESVANIREALTAMKETMLETERELKAIRGLVQELVNNKIVS